MKRTRPSQKHLSPSSYCGRNFFKILTLQLQRCFFIERCLFPSWRPQLQLGSSWLRPPHSASVHEMRNKWVENRLSSQSLFNLKAEHFRFNGIVTWCIFQVFSWKSFLFLFIVRLNSELKLCFFPLFCAIHRILEIEIVYNIIRLLRYGHAPWQQQKYTLTINIFLKIESMSTCCTFIWVWFVCCC